MEERLYHQSRWLLFALLLAAAILLTIQPARAAQPSAPGAAPGSEVTVMDVFTETVLTLNISNEAPGRLIDALISQGHGDDTLFEVLGYLKDQSGGLIPDAFYQDVAGAPVGSEVFIAHLSSYAGTASSLEISADGTVHLRNLKGSAYVGASGYATAPSQDGHFTLTTAQDPLYHIYTGQTQVQVGLNTYIYNYNTFGIVWWEGLHVYLPLVLRDALPCFTDDFASPGSGWFTGAGAGWSVAYFNGEYRIHLTQKETWAWGSPLEPLPEDYRLEVDARLTTAGDGAYGIIFGAGEQNLTGYAFTIFPAEQAYVITRHNGDGTFTTLEDEDFTSIIHAGTAVNRLRVDRIGSSIHAYVNNVLVATWDDNRFMGAGAIFGLVAYSYTASDIDARFDNVSACQAGLSCPLYTEDFAVTDRWYTGDHGWGAWSYQSGAYEMLLRNTNSWMYSMVPLEGGLPRFALQADMRLSTGDQGLYGLNFGHVDEQHLYNFRVYPAAQQYALFKASGATWTPLVNWTVSPAIHAGVAPNTLRVERDGETIRLYANGVLLRELSDASYVGNQEMSLYAGSWNQAPVAMRYDNVTFCELP